VVVRPYMIAHLSKGGGSGEISSVKTGEFSGSGGKAQVCLYRVEESVGIERFAAVREGAGRVLGVLEGSLFCE
jgi:hypothetical protein